MGHLREGTRPLHVQKPKFGEACPEAAKKEHLQVAAGEAGSGGCQSLNLGDVFRQGCS